MIRSERRRTTVVTMALAAASALLVVGCDNDPTVSRDSAARPGSTSGTAQGPGTGVDPSVVPAGVDAVVTSVTDGDTVVVRTSDGSVERVRLIGIDTPEIRDPRRPVECFGREASAQTAMLIPPGTEVRLERDAELRDRYDRLLAYVWRLDDGTFVNARLVEGGWAVPYRFPPNVRYADELSRLGAEARAANRGLWSACGGPDTPVANRS